MEPHYRHTQAGLVLLTLAFFLGAAFVVGLFTPSIPHATLITLGATALVSYLFGSLTVVVDADTIRCWFGPGLIHKTIPLDEVKAVKAVRNSWLHGWGIRYIGNGWMFNVAGLDAVELTLASGRRFRIGTDQPAELEAAIWRAMALPE